MNTLKIIKELKKGEKHKESNRALWKRNQQIFYRIKGNLHK